MYVNRVIIFCVGLHLLVRSSGDQILTIAVPKLLLFFLQAAVSVGCRCMHSSSQFVSDVRKHNFEAERRVGKTQLCFRVAEIMLHKTEAQGGWAVISRAA